jgi:PAS domain S-box-containing protein
VLQALPAAIYTTDAAGRISFYNEAAVELSGRRPQLGTDSWCVTWRLYQPDGTPMPHDECPMAVALREDRAVRGAEAIAERPDGVRIPFIPYPAPLHDAAGRVTGAVNMLVDISHRKEAETQQRLMFSELNHRIKNNMQMLHALLGAELRKASSPAARTALTDAISRVSAMASAQNVLYLSNHAGTFDIEEFFATVIAGASLALPDGVSIECGAVAAGQLANDTAVPLALILNELITNAVRHAMAGRDAGRIAIALVRDGETLVMSVEDDGPGFVFPHVRSSKSGLDLVAGLARQLDGGFAVERGTGARCVLRFPAARAVPP